MGLTGKGEKMKSLRLALVGLVAVTLFGATSAFGDEDNLPDDPKLLKATVRMLQSTLKSKDDQLAAAEQRIGRPFLAQIEELGKRTQIYKDAVKTLHERQSALRGKCLEAGVAIEDNAVSVGVIWNNVSDIPVENRRKIKLPVDYGFIVQEIVVDSAAEAAGIKQFDCITAIDGVKLEDDLMSTALLLRYQPGQTATLSLYRPNPKTEAFEPVMVSVKFKKSTATDQKNTQEALAQVNIGKWGGFRGIAWGTRREDIKGLVHVDADEKQGNTYFKRQDDNLAIGKASLNSIFYIFYKGRFSSVAILASGNANFEALKQALIEYYGDFQQPNRFIKDYRWAGAERDGKEMRVGLNFNDISEECILGMGYGPIHDQQEKDNKEAAKKAKKDF